MLKVELKTVMLSTEQRMEWRKKVEKMNLSEEMKDTLSRWIVFKEEYKKITQFLTQNPTVTEDEILHQMFEIVFQYEKEIGISRGHRECLSSNGSEFRSID